MRGTVHSPNELDVRRVKSGVTVDVHRIRCELLCQPRFDPIKSILKRRTRHADLVRNLGDRILPRFLVVPVFNGGFER